MPEKETVLIIDDDPMISDALSSLLRAEGFEVRCCADGESALGAARERCYSIILTDYRMPGVSGADITRVLRAKCPVAFIIGLSAEPKKREDFLAAGANAFLNKPFMPDELMALIRVCRPN